MRHAAGQRGRRVLLIDHADKAGKKILFPAAAAATSPTSHAAPDRLPLENPHFCKSALARYTPRDFIAMVERHGIAYHEKKLGQLFCDDRPETSSTCC